MQRTETIYNHIIFDPNPPVVKEMSFEAIVDNARRWTSNDHESSPWAKGSGELKSMTAKYGNKIIWVGGIFMGR